MITKNPISRSVEDPLGAEESSAGARLILALDRLFKVGPYYPPGHAATKRVTSDFQNVVRHFLQDQMVLVFRMDKGQLHLQDEPLSVDLPGVQDFQDLLGGLGIDHLEIDKNASVEDLLAFVTRFLAFRNEIAGVKKFQQMSFEGLPSTVRIDERRFQTGIAIGATAPRPQDLPTEGSELEVNPGTEIAEITQELLSETLDEAGDDHAPGGDAPVPVEPVGAIEVENATLTDILEHAQNPDGHVVAAPPKLAENKRPVADGLDQLINGLEATQQGDIRSRALESVELMIRNLGRGGRNGQQHADFLGTEVESASDRQQRTIQKKPAEQAAEQPVPKKVFLMEMPDLRSALADYAGKAVTATYSSERDHTENLSIMMQMLVDKQAPDVLTSIERKLVLMLKRKLQPAERTVVVSGIRTVLEQSEPASLFKSLPLLARVFRKSKLESVIRLFGDVYPGCDDNQIATFWPYVANEVLLGNDGDDKICFMGLCRHVGDLDLEAMRNQTQVLRKLAALKRGTFSEDVIQPPLYELFPVFSVLLESSHPGQIAVKLVRGLKYEPPGLVGEAVLPLIDTYRHSYREFLVDLFAPGQEDGPSETLLESAARILSTDLLALDPKRRGEEWVPETIVALSMIPVPNVEKILKTIIGRRFLFLVNTWPKPCRKAAHEARARIHLAQLAAEAAAEAATEAAAESGMEPQE